VIFASWIYYHTHCSLVVMLVHGFTTACRYCPMNMKTTAASPDLKTPAGLAISPDACLTLVSIHIYTCLRELLVSTQVCVHHSVSCHKQLFIMCKSMYQYSNNEHHGNIQCYYVSYIMQCTQPGAVYAHMPGAVFVVVGATSNPGMYHTCMHACSS